MTRVFFIIWALWVLCVCWYQITYRNFTLKIVNNLILVHCQGLWTCTCSEFWCNQPASQQIFMRFILWSEYDVHVDIRHWISAEIRWIETNHVSSATYKQFASPSVGRSVGRACGCALNRMHLIEFHHPKWDHPSTHSQTHSLQGETIKCLLKILAAGKFESIKHHRVLWTFYSTINVT